MANGLLFDRSISENQVLQLLCKFYKFLGNLVISLVTNTQIFI